ncbi:TIM-barrel domain-containing protein [Sphaerisporangium corydalis]|uniref:TIM-barrel domain-containing protein n=1 Tax=Sphaerisporangium corydalis TaxID=1441875 RepID=A0ABV9EHD2_9ACTN|nr:TIM-barrel domain-containing protein [Sphaerisporangium corydalis]
MRESQTVLERPAFRLRLGGPTAPFVHLDFETFTQPLLIGVGVDAPEALDREIDLVDRTIADRGEYERITWTAKSTRWDKFYHLDVYRDRLEFHAEVIGNGPISAVRYFETVEDATFREHFALTKHFNDKRHTPVRAYSRPSPTAFRRVFSPEPNTYGRQEFQPYENVQISVNADLDYQGGNLVANPGLLCFAVAARPEHEWLTFGLRVQPGEYHFSDYEYVGGEGFGLHLSCPGEVWVEGRAETPRVVMVLDRDPELALRSYVTALRAPVARGAFTDAAVSGATVPSASAGERPSWWSRPIVSGWGHQSYQGDLFRIRSPRERQKDNAVYTLCTEPNYRDIVRRLDDREVPWGTLVIDARWFLAAGLKNLDPGRWPDMRGFVDHVHSTGRRVLLWWGPWDPEGLPDDECVLYRPADRPARPLKRGKWDRLRPGSKVAIDVTLPQARERIRRQLRQVLGSGPGCFDIDGLKIDHVSATPAVDGMAFNAGSRRLFGIEAAKEMHRLIYQTAKEIKPDALIMGQSPNPYFADVLDMVRLGDIYTRDRDSVVADMAFRARMARIADENWLIDTDGWPLPSLSAFREYVEAQPGLGVPSLYYATHLDTTGEALTEAEFALIRSAWADL